LSGIDHVVDGLLLADPKIESLNAQMGAAISAISLPIVEPMSAELR
jgi:hypothetical protein